MTKIGDKANLNFFLKYEGNFNNFQFLVKSF